VRGKRGVRGARAGVVTVTDDGQARVLADEIPDAQRESAMQAVQGCPARALAAED